jgi:hypothetical protein
MLQGILEKFEFFPIKCRIQHSQDVFNIAQQNIAARDKQFRRKVQECGTTLVCDNTVTGWFELCYCMIVMTVT